MTATQFKPSPVTAHTDASDKSVNYLAALRGIDKNDENFAEWFLAKKEEGQKEVSRQIKEVIAAKDAKPKFALAKGQWHFLKGVFLRVAVSQSTGKLYAKARVPGSGFVFASGIIYKLGEATLVNASHTPEISAYGHTHERCVFCNLPLDQPESITAGYGETCAGNYGLPWG